MKKIAIIGAGLAGLALAWHLTQFPAVSVTLFDPAGPGGGASGVSTGLLHPFPGRLALRSWRAKEGLEATRELLQVAQKALGRAVFENSGVLRLATQESIDRHFKKRAAKDPEAILWSPEQVRAKIPGAIGALGLWIPSGIAVYSKLYLQGLWKACSERGAKLELSSVGPLEELSPYDRIVIAAGHETLRWAELPLERVRGRSLLCRWPERLPCSLAGLGHITPTEDPTLCQIGSTYEREPLTESQAIEELKAKAAAFYPPALAFEIVSVNEGIRLSTNGGYRPLVRKIDERIWVFTGLGSRGMLYHALLARELADLL